MSTSTSNQSYNWLIEVGVPPMEVHWLRNIVGSSQFSHPVAQQRVKVIQDQAYMGLLKTVNPHTIRSPLSI